ncbi:hypothetical protein VRY54_02600 [Actinomyces sp. F1_1611]
MSQHIDQEELKKKAAEIKDVVSEQAVKAFEKASEATKTGVKTAAPRVLQAVDDAVKTASPYVDTAAERAAKLTSKAGDALDQFHEDMVKDYLPRLSSAVEEAAARAKAEAEKVGETVVEAPVAAVEAAANSRGRHRKSGKIFRWGLLAGAAAGAGYLLWRRSQPIEDPWAEEYWADLDTDEPVEEIAPEEVAGVEAEVAEVADAAPEETEPAAEEAGEEK